MTHLYFQAQALDDISPDHYQDGYTLLGPDEEIKIREITQVIFKISQKGDIQLDENGAKFIFLDPEFLIQVYSGELDPKGRHAPLLGYGKFTNTDKNRRSKEISDAILEIQGFAKKIGRTIDHKHIEIFKRESKNLPKKNSEKIPVAIGILIITSLLTTAIILKKTGQKQDKQQAHPTTPITPQEETK